MLRKIGKHRVTIPCKWVFWLKSAEFHEIWQISWNPHEIWQISWNPPDFRWNLVHVKSTPNLVKAGVSTKTIQFDECRRGAITLDFMKSGVIAPSMHPPNWRVFVETSDFIRLWVDFKIMSFCVMIKYRSFVFRKTKNRNLTPCNNTKAYFSCFYTRN